MPEPRNRRPTPGAGSSSSSPVAGNIPDDASYGGGGALAPAGPPADVLPLAGDIEQVLEELGDSAAVVSLWKYDERGKPGYLERIPVAEFTLEHVKQAHGGGRYQGRILDPMERNKRQVSFTIAGPPRAEGSSSGSSSSSGGGGRLERLEALVEQLAGMVATRATAPAAPPADPLEQLERLSTVFRNMQPAAVASSPLDALQLIREGMEIARTAGPRESDGFGEFAAHMGKPLAEMLSQSVKNDAAAVRRPTLPPRPPVATVPAPTAPAAPNGAALAPPAWVLRVRPFLPMIATVARSQADPELYVEPFLDFLAKDEPAYLELATELEVEGTAERLGRYIPALAKHVAWLEKFLDACKVSMAENAVTVDGEELEELGAGDLGGDDESGADG